MWSSSKDSIPDPFYPDDSRVAPVLVDRLPQLLAQPLGGSLQLLWVGLGRVASICNGERRPSVTAGALLLDPLILIRRDPDQLADTGTGGAELTPLFPESLSHSHSLSSAPNNRVHLPGRPQGT